MEDLRKLALPDPRRGLPTLDLATLGRCGVTPLAALEAGVFPSCWVRNAHSLDAAAQARLARSRVAVVGVGGLGGYILEELARIGVGSLRVVDGDVFEETNLNRQLLAEPETIGRFKAEVAVERLRKIAPWCRAEDSPVFLDACNAPKILAGVDVVVDALGGIACRLELHEACARLGLPVVAAAVAGWTAVVGSETPDCQGISLLWQDTAALDAEGQLGSLAPVVALAASLQAAEVVRYLVARQLSLGGKVLHVDLESWNWALYEIAPGA